MTVLITLTTAGYSTGPFSLYSDVGAYATPFEVGVSKSSLVAGYTSSLVPDGTTIVRVQSTGVCNTQVDLTIVTTTTTTTTTTSTTTTTTSTTTTTTTAAPTFVSFSLTYSSSAGATACSDYTDPTNRNFYYAAPGSTLTTGTVLYTTSDLVTPVANGFYSNGVDYWNTAASVGNLQEQTSCGL